MTKLTLVKGHNTKAVAQSLLKKIATAQQKRDISESFFCALLTEIEDKRQARNLQENDVQKLINGLLLLPVSDEMKEPKRRALSVLQVLKGGKR